MRLMFCQTASQILNSSPYPHAGGMMSRYRGSFNVGSAHTRQGLAPLHPHSFCLRRPCRGLLAAKHPPRPCQAGRHARAYFILGRSRDRCARLTDNHGTQPRKKRAVGAPEILRQSPLTGKTPRQDIKVLKSR